MNIQNRWPGFGVFVSIKKKVPVGSCVIEKDPIASEDPICFYGSCVRRLLQKIQFLRSAHHCDLSIAADRSDFHDLIFSSKTI